MKRASGLRDLSDDRKAGDRSGFEARSPLRQIDRILDGLRDDEIGIARLGAPRERDDEVRDRPSLLGREAVGERRHRRAVEPRGHRPEDILAGRPSPEGPGLREVCRAYRLPEVVHQRWSRRSVAPTEVTVALQAAGLHVELLPELDRLLRGGRRARELQGLGDTLRVREVGREGRNEVGEIRHFLVGQVGPGGHRGVGHAAPDDVDEVLMGRERSAGSRPNLEPAGREVPGPGEQMRGGIARAVTLLAVALRTILEVHGSCPTPAVPRSRRRDPALRLRPLSRRSAQARAPIPSARRTTRQSGQRNTRAALQRRSLCLDLL